MMTACAPMPCIEVLALDRRPPQAVTEWAREHLYLTDGPLVGPAGSPTPWRSEAFPLQSAVMEAIGDERWSKVLVMTAPQAFGKTHCAALAAVLHGIHERRVSALYMAARMPLSQTQWHQKFLPVIEADRGGMAGLIYENPDFGGDKDQRRFTNGTTIHFAGAESAGAVAGFTVPIVVCDDLQAYPAAVPRFGHPADLAWSRAGAYPERLRTLIGIGTAGTLTDYLWRSMVRSTLFCPFVPCPECGTYQLLEWERLVFDKTDPDAAITETWLRCAGHCDHHITFDDLPGMLAEHRWVSCPPAEDWVTEPDEAGTTIDLSDHAVYPETRRATTVAGFWCNALYWPLGRSWGELAADWIDRQGNPDRMKDHQQQIRVVPWQEPEEDAEMLTMTDLGEHRDRGHKYQTVPADKADLLILTSDVHDRFIYYVARAWCKADGTSWLVDAGTLGVHGPHKGETLAPSERQAMIGQAIREALEDLWTMEAGGWPVVRETGESCGDGLRASLCLIDGGYRPDAVGQFCRLRNAGLPGPRWLMTIGASRHGGATTIWSAKPRKNRRGHLFWEVGVDEAKHVLRELMAVPRGNPGYMHSYGDRDLEAYHRHMISEHFVTKRSRGREVHVWEQREGGGPNHWWDCEVLQIAAATALKVHLRTDMWRDRPAITANYDRKDESNVKASKWKIGR